MSVMTDDRVQAARKQAETVASDARRQAEEILSETRKQAGRARSKAAGVSAKLIGAVGAVGLVAGYFLSRIRRDADRTHQAAEPASQDQVPAGA
jgi:F0F1-type ATP synthase assembly protein I